MPRFLRILGRRRGSPSREAEVVSALRELEQTLQQVEEQLRSGASPSRPEPARADPAPPPAPRAPEPSSATAELAEPEVRREEQPAQDPQPDPPRPTLEGAATEAPPEPTRPSASAPEQDGPFFAQRVEVDVGPFADFGALSLFERELARVPDVIDVHVRRFFDDRAILELTATRELQLLGLFRAALPYRFELERVERESLKITLSAE
jgi:hypothetical protein